MLDKKSILGIYCDSTFNFLEISLIETDGIDVFAEPKSLTRPYPAGLKEKLYQFILKNNFDNFHDIKSLENETTAFHIDCVNAFLSTYNLSLADIAAFGYSGEVLYFAPQQKRCLSIGNAPLLAQTFKTPVIHQFIQSDLSAGGCGGPLFASYYEAITRNIPKPLAILSFGGITTITLIGDLGELFAFDIALGTTLLDHWIYQKTGAEMDFDGQLSAKGTFDEKVVNALLKMPYLQKTPPKSTNKHDLKSYYHQITGLSPENGAATITQYIAKSIKNAQSFLPIFPTSYILIGGGIKNPTLLRQIRHTLSAPTHTPTNLNWQNDTLNAQAYAFLAARHSQSLPISYPTTTGVATPTTGGVLVK